MENNKLLAVVRIRGKINMNRTISNTLDILKLYKKNYCVLIRATDSLLGMVKKVKDFVTFGEIDEQTLIELLRERGRLAGGVKLTEDILKNQKLTFEGVAKDLITQKKNLKDIKGLKLFFRLSPPRGGFEKKGIKHPFSIGGVLGYRKDKINALVKKML